MKVLLAEDENMNAMITQMLLEQQNIEVVHAPNGEEIISIFKNNSSADLILMDIQMPKIDGIEATRIIRALNDKGATIPIVAFTASETAEELGQCYSAGMNDHLPKPFTPADFNDLLNRLNIIKK